MRPNRNGIALSSSKIPDNLMTSHCERQGKEPSDGRTRCDEDCALAGHIEPHIFLLTIAHQRSLSAPKEKGLPLACGRKSLAK